MISVSSWTASSAPATSEKVTLGWSLVILRARLLPKLMTLFPPPCIELMNRMKNSTMSKMGARVPSNVSQKPVFCGSTEYAMSCSSSWAATSVICV